MEITWELIVGFVIGVVLWFIIFGLLKKKTRKNTLEFLGAIYLLLMIVLMSPSIIIGFLWHVCKNGYESGYQIYDDLIDNILKDDEQHENNH